MPLRLLEQPLRLLYGMAAALVLTLVLVPLCLLIIVTPTLKARRAIGRAGVKLAMAAIGQPLAVHGLERLPAGPAICVANHASYVDGLLLTAALPARFTFLVQHRAASWPLVGATIRRMGVAFVDRWSPRAAALATRDLLRRLAAGESLAIFAEGTFRAEPGLMAFQSGAFMIATKAGVPIVPAVIHGSRRLFGQGMRLPAPSRLSIDILPAISAQGEARAVQTALHDGTRAAILARCGEPDARDRPHTPFSPSDTQTFVIKD